MPDRYVHRIDPVLADVGGIYIWWYGLGYTLGFLQLYLFARRHRTELGLTSAEVYRLAVMVAAGVLLGGRAVEVAFDEWAFYRAHPWLVPALWLGGMATHGLLIGAAAGTGLFVWLSRRPFLELADALVIPGAKSRNISKKR